MCCLKEKATAASKWADLDVKRCARTSPSGGNPVARKNIRDSQGIYEAWSGDQWAKREFFHQKLHEWGLTEIAEALDRIKGESLTWDIARLGIVESAWNKIIHRGIKPILIFAHPDVLQSVSQAVAYYRMLAMVSQKSMNNLRINVTRFENGQALPDVKHAWEIAIHLNPIISALIQPDTVINPREFDIWRGMAAGAQADGSWRNLKGKKTELVVKSAILRRLRSGNLIEAETPNEIALKDGRIIIFADEPDIAIYSGNILQVAIEVKGGIDTAGILERVGAAIKSLSRAFEENPNAITILLLQGVSVTQRAIEDLGISKHAVHHWFTVEEFLEAGEQQENIFN
jgi:hypothetical protein